MGSPVAPNVRNIFMLFFEQYVFQGPHGAKILQWMRYVDDVFLLWSGTERELDDFQQNLNNCHEFIELSITESQHHAKMLKL